MGGFFPGKVRWRPWLGSDRSGGMSSVCRREVPSSRVVTGCWCRVVSQSAVCLRVTAIAVNKCTTPEHLFDEDGMEV